MATKKDIEKELQELRKCEDLKVIDILTSYNGRRRILVYDSTSVTPWQVIGEDSAWYFRTEEEARAWRRGESGKHIKKKQSENCPKRTMD